MGLADSTIEIMQWGSDFLHEIDGLNIPFSDTLNLMNGVNYAQFLEAFLMIANQKTKAKEGSGDSAQEFNRLYKETLKDIFENATFEMEKRMKIDQFLVNVFSEGVNRVFFEHSVLLQSVFETFGIIRNGTYLELDKDSFVRMLKESEILILPKPKEEVKAAAGRGRGAPRRGAAAKETEEKEEEKKPEAEAVILFTENDAMNAIEPCQSFDHNMLNYYDFLEALCRIADVYPFTKVQLLDDMESFDNRVDFLCSKLEAKNFDLMQKFEMERQAINEERRYQPRSVVQDIMGDDLSDEDD
jgi:ribosomal protein L12E/L44/L45/RPP1/RPP2